MMASVTNSSYGGSQYDLYFFLGYVTCCRHGRMGSVDFGSDDSDFWIFGIMFISLIQVSLIIDRVQLIFLDSIWM